MQTLNIYDADTNLIIAKIKSITDEKALEVAKELYGDTDYYGWSYATHGLIDDGNWEEHSACDENGNLI